MTQLARAAETHTAPGGAPLRIVWLEDGPYVASEPAESTACVIDGGKVTQRASCMVSRAIRPATKQEVREWRIRR